MSLQPLARVLLRSESIASSKMEKTCRLTLVGYSAPGGPRSDLSQTIGSDAVEVIANIHTIEFSPSPNATAPRRSYSATSSKSTPESKRERAEAPDRIAE